MTPTIILQARLGGARLPGKVLADVDGRPMLTRVMARLWHCREVRSTVVAIPDTPANDPLADFIRARGWALHRGPEEDTVARYAGAALKYDADPIVRVTADCPLLDPDVIDATLRMYQTGEYDFAANNIERSFPHGLDVEVFSLAALLAARDEVTDPVAREGVTHAVLRHGLKVGNLKSRVDLSGYRWTVDYGEDLAFVSSVYGALRGMEVSTVAVLRLCDEQPALREINAMRRVA